MRIPAAFCGVVGFKPTYGLLPTAGVEALSPTCDHVGLLGRDVGTTRRLLAALTSGATGSPHPGPLRLGVLRGQLDHPQVEQGVAQAVRQALVALVAAGHLLVDLTVSDAGVLTELNELLGPIVLYEAWGAHCTRFAKDPAAYGPQTRRLLETAATLDRTAYELALVRRAVLLPAAAQLLDGLDALVGPCVPFVAPTTTPPFDSAAGDLEGLFTGAYNVTGQPAVTVPCDSDGLPVGLQLAGKIGGDDRLLAVAEEVERCLRTGPGAPTSRS